MSEEQTTSNQPAKPAVDPNATRGLSVPPPPQSIVQPLQEGQNVPPPPTQLIGKGLQVPPPAPALVRPVEAPQSVQPSSGGQSPQSTPPPAPAQSNTGSSSE
jgi:hypothetical protein